MPERLRGIPLGLVPRWAAGRLLAAVLALAAVSGCSPAVEGDPTDPEVVIHPVGGTWAYAASDLRLAGGGGTATCQVTGLRLHIDQLRHRGQVTPTLTGTTSGGTLTCGGELSHIGGPIDPFPLTKGNTHNSNIAFSIGSDDWRNSGLLAAGDSMDGQVWLRHGSIRFEGTFVAKRTSR